MNESRRQESDVNVSLLDEIVDFLLSVVMTSSILIGIETMLPLAAHY